MPVTSVRTRLLLLLLGLTSVAVVVIAIIAVNSAQSGGRTAQQMSSQALRDQAEDYLVQLTLRTAKENDLLLDRVYRDAQKIAAYTAAVFDNPLAFANDTYWRAEDHMTTGTDGQYVNGEDDLTSVFVPNLADVDETTLRDIELSAYLDLILAPIYESDTNTVAIYFATPRDMVRYYPNINLGAVLPPDFQATERVWYTGSTLQDNPQRAPWWTPVYVDATGRGLVTTAAAPVYNQRQELVGVVGIDVTLNDIKANVEATRFLQSGYSFLIDETGHAIALPEQGYRDILGRPPEPSEFGTDLSSTTTGFAPILTQMMASESGFESIEVDERELFVAYAPLESTGWSLGSVVEAGNVLQAIASLQGELENATRSLVLTRILPVSGAMFILVITLGLVLTNRLVDPIQKLAAAAQKIGAGQWDAEIPRTGNDEIGVLAHAFESMANQLHGMVMQLEKRVAERTHDLERRAVQLQVAAEVARDATVARELNDLLNHAVNLIRDRFGFYHAGIFLMDERGEYVVLRAATGEAGRQMLEREHKLKVGEVGIVGYVTGTGQPRIALDVGADAVHFKNPLLPETRSEMALPLKVGERVIGALDVQSTEEAAFDEDDVTVLQTMADQLAVAIENARLLHEMKQSMRELEAARKRHTQESWRDFVQSAGRTRGYRYRQLGVEPVAEQHPEAREALQQGRPILTTIPQGEATLQEDLRRAGEPAAEGDGQDVSEALAVPIKLRDQVIGVLNLRFEGEEISPETVSLVEEAADRLALAMENARLVQEAQYMALREQQISLISARARSSINMETIMQDTVRELGKALGSSRTFIQLGLAPEPTSIEGETPNEEI